jgi:hypothetical protein
MMDKGRRSIDLDSLRVGTIGDDRRRGQVTRLLVLLQRENVLR